MSIPAVRRSRTNFIRDKDHHYFATVPKIAGVPLFFAIRLRERSPFELPSTAPGRRPGRPPPSSLLSALQNGRGTTVHVRRKHENCRNRNRHVAFFHRTSKQNFIRLSLGRREGEREREREGKGSKRRGVASRLVSSRRLASRHVTSRHVTSRHVTSGAQRSNGTNLASGRRFARTIAINRQPIGRHVTHVRTRERGRFFLDRRPAGRRCPPLTDPRNPLFGRNERRDRPREWERDSKRAPRRAGK